MSYVTVQDVYRTSGLREQVISYADVLEHIKVAENDICRITKNIYWLAKLNSANVSSATDNTVTVDDAGWVAEDYSNNYVYIYSGTGTGQIRKIITNTDDKITVDRDWITNPDSTSYFKIFYVPEQFNPFREDIFDGNGMSYIYLPYYPVKVVELISIDDNEITDYYKWEKTGRIQLKGLKFTPSNPQNVLINYWYGVDFLPFEVKRLVELKAALQIMGQQMGGTFDVPSTVSLPDASLSIGQAYINIKSSMDELHKEYEYLLSKVVKVYPVFG